jgi:ribonuclease P protein component
MARVARPCCRTGGRPLTCASSHHSWWAPVLRPDRPRGRPRGVSRGERWIMMSPHSGSCGRLRRVRIEAHLPTEQPSPGSQARLPQPHEHPCRSCRAEGPAGQGPPQAVGLIWRIRERSVFARLSQDGARARAGVLWCTFLPDPSASPPRVAFAIGRAVGPAVVRNQVRRRLRALLSAAPEDRTLPPGWYLVGGRPSVAARTFPQLSSDVEALIASVQAHTRRLAAASAPLSNVSSTPTTPSPAPPGPPA